MSFDFFNVPRIVFGRGQIARLWDFIPRDSRVLLIFNGREIEGRWSAKARQRGEPTITDIDAALTTAREAQCDFVIGLGGGSAIDAAKAVAGLLSNGGVATDYMEVVGKGQKITKPAAPWIAIPTTAGTGAEVTRNAVVGWPERKFKASIRSELLLAKVALIDPELAFNLPPDVTARCGMDALCQCIEAYVSSGANAMTDVIALKGVELAGRYLKRVYDDGQDIEAREGMAMAALMSGIALANAGLGAVHGFAAPLGATFPVPHGTACGLLLPHVIEANRRQGVAKYADIDRALGGDTGEVCTTLVNQLKLPKLATFGIKGSAIPAMVDLAKRASSMRYNPVDLSDNALAEILRRAIDNEVAFAPRVRNFTPADAGAFRDLNEEWLKRYFHVEPKDIKVLGDPIGQIIAPGGHILILELDGRPIGCCALIKLDDQTFELAKMAITKSHQGKGLGKTLLQAVIERARMLGAARLYLESNSRLKPALTLYRKLGFVDLPPDAIGPTEYARVDVWMELRLR